MEYFLGILLATGNTSVCDCIFEYVGYITVCVIRENISSRICCNSEAYASELQQLLEENEK